MLVTGSRGFAAGSGDDAARKRPYQGKQVFEAAVVRRRGMMNVEFI
jgi:hypothetical protein